MQNNNKENQLLAITYVQSAAKNDQETMKLVEASIDPLILARETALIATQLVGTLALTIDEKSPATVDEIMQNLREIHYGRK